MHDGYCRLHIITSKQAIGINYTMYFLQNIYIIHTLLIIAVTCTVGYSTLYGNLLVCYCTILYSTHIIQYISTSL